MKKFFLIVIFSIMFFPLSIFAESGSISITSSSSSAVVGSNIKVNVAISSNAEAWDFTIGYDKAKLRLVNSTMESEGVTSVGTSLTNSSRNYTLTFKAIDSGGASIYVSDGVLYSENESVLSLSKGSKTINVITEEELKQSFSSNNNLSSLYVVGYDLNPSFDKKTLKYTVELEAETTDITVNAAVEDSKATVTGTGNIAVSDGNNNIVISVTAENGEVKKYEINAVVLELDPIKVKINNKEYTFIRKKELLSIPNGYVETTVNIDNVEIPALHSNVTKFTLVGLKDEKGNINLYIYDKDKKTYTLYNEIKFKSMSILPLDMKMSLLPKGYVKSDLSYDGKKIVAYKYKSSSKFGLVYGLNTETGDKNLYMIDSVDGTVQRYNGEMIKSLNNEINMYKMVIIGLVILDILFLIILLIVKIVKKKKNKKRNSNLNIDESSHEKLMKMIEKQKKKNEKKSLYSDMEKL